MTINQIVALCDCGLGYTPEALERLADRPRDRKRSDPAKICLHCERAVWADLCENCKEPLPMTTDGFRCADLIACNDRRAGAEAPDRDDDDEDFAG